MILLSLLLESASLNHSLVRSFCPQLEILDKRHLMRQLACFHIVSGGIIAECLDVCCRGNYMNNLEWKVHNYDTLYANCTSNLQLHELKAEIRGWGMGWGLIQEVQALRKILTNFQLLSTWTNKELSEAHLELTMWECRLQKHCMKSLNTCNS